MIVCPSEVRIAHTHTHTPHTHTHPHPHTHTHHRGLSSTVRKCVSRETGLEYAVKIIDKSQEEAITESIQAEIQVLNTVPPHKHISESFLTIQRSLNALYLSSRVFNFKSLIPPS